MRSLVFGRTYKFFGFIALVGIILCLTALQQDDFFVRIQKKLSAYYENRAPLKLSLFLNQPAYVPGDTLYFNVSLLVADNLRPVAGTSTINISLVDSLGKIISNQKIRIFDGRGFNQVVVSNSVKPGLYTLVAYNEWMRNGDESLFAHSRIRIAGDKKITKEQRYDFDFFPEGGHIIEEISNKIIFTGSPSSTVEIRSTDKQFSETLKLNEVGMGVFFLTPRQNTSYYVTSGASRKDIVSEKDGVGLLVTASEDASLQCKLQIPATSVLRNQTLRLVLSSHSQLYFGATINFKTKSDVNIKIPRKDIDESLSMITIFGSDESVLAQRMVQISFPKTESKILLTGINQTYHPREKVVIDLDVPPGKSIISMTVFNTDFFMPEEMDYDFKNSVETFLDLPFNGLAIPQKLKENIGSEQWNDFLITQKWLGFSWPDVLNDKTRNNYPLEKYLVFKGKVIRRDGTPFQDTTRVSFFLQKSKETYTVELNSKGEFDFPLIFDFYDEEEVYYIVKDRNGSIRDVAIEISNDSMVKFYHSGFHPSSQPDSLTVFSKRKNTLDSSFNTMLKTVSFSKAENRNQSIEKWELTPDITIQLKDYILFPSMPETIREIVPYLSYGLKNGRDIVRVQLKDDSVNPPMVRAGSEDPIYIIDGVVTDNTNYFINLSPSEVANIQVIFNEAKLARVEFGENGIVIVETKINNNHKNVPRSETVFRVNGLTKAKAFNQTVNESSNLRVPKFNTTLYFNPQIITDKNGKATISFYTPDNTGNFRVRAQGFNSTGEPFSIEKDFTVKF